MCIRDSLNTLVKELDLKGTLHILRHGFKFYGKTFRLAQFKPAHGLNDEIKTLYEKNRLTVTRQVLCHPGKHETVDMVFAVKLPALPRGASVAKPSETTP